MREFRSGWSKVFITTYLYTHRIGWSGWFVLIIFVLTLFLLFIFAFTVYYYESLFRCLIFILTLTLQYKPAKPNHYYPRCKILRIELMLYSFLLYSLVHQVRKKRNFINHTQVTILYFRWLQQLLENCLL